jgi:integrase/recombinase XerD
MTSILKDFAAWLYQVGYSKGMRHMLPACVKEFVEQQRITSALYIETEQVQAFYGWLQTRPLKKRSGALSEMMIHHYVYGLRTFFSWLEITEQIDYNPISGMKFRRPTQNKRHPLTKEEVGQLFASATSLKETTVLHLFYSCGLRRSEGESLNIADVRYKERLLYVPAGKGAKRRVVPVTIAVAKALESYWLQERCTSQVKKVKDEDAFILNQVGGRMSGEGYNDLFKRLAAKAGLGEGITLHHLRHSIATHLLQSGMGLEYVRDFLGHGFLETTQIYAQPDPKQLSLL